MLRQSGSLCVLRLHCSSIAVFSLAFFSLGSPTVFSASVGLHRLATGLNQPVFATFAPGDSERLFVLERNGKIRILDLAMETVAATPFLNITDANTSGEGGLLGLAFHPDYQSNGRFYTYVTVADGGTPFRSHIREYTVSANPNIANSTPTEVLTWSQPQSNHNGGWIGFSPLDGYLYIMSGDGGGGNDTGTGHTAITGNAQDITNNLLGKVLRIDVDGTNGTGGNYGNPASNPFVGVTGDDEIWAYGLRNPYRSSFDRQTGDLWIGDVGQGAREEIDFQAASSTGGENYGWRLREGTIATPTAGIGGAAPPGAIGPIYEYTHGNGTFQGYAVIGGYVYRGPDPELQGTYFFGDQGSANLWTRNPSTGSVSNVRAMLPPDAGSLGVPVSFGEDAFGNLYIVDIATSGNLEPNTGEIYRVITNAVVAGDFNGDGLVDSRDLIRWQTGYGITTNAKSTDGDADEDADVDGNDFLIWQRNQGKTAQDPPSLLANEPLQVPEPTTLALLAVGVLGFRWPRRK